MWWGVDGKNSGDHKAFGRWALMVPVSGPLSLYIVLREIGF